CQPEDICASFGNCLCARGGYDFGCMSHRIKLVRGFLLSSFCCVMIASNSARAADSLADAAQLSARAACPDPLVMLGGTPATSKKLWVTKRRTELKELFQHYMYGLMPPAPAQ